VGLSSRYHINRLRYWRRELCEMSEKVNPYDVAMQGVLMWIIFLVVCAIVLLELGVVRAHI